VIGRVVIHDDDLVALRVEVLANEAVERTG
jgi:hypothetical protein